MKILKKHGLTMMLVVALIVTLTLGIIFMLPAKAQSVSADETDIFANAVEKSVSDETALRNAVNEATTNPTVIQLENNIELTTLDETGDNAYALAVERGQIIKLDLAGHKLSVPAKYQGEGNVIVNKGTLYVVDSSVDEQGVKNYQGEVVSNGYVSKTGAYGRAEEGALYWWPAKAAIRNHGALTLNAKVSIHIPKSGGNNEPFTTGAYSATGDIFSADMYLVQSQLDPTPSGDGQTITPASLTVEGGIYDLAFKFDDAGMQWDLNIFYPMNHYFLLCEADLTINGGTFRNTFGYNPVRTPGFLAELVSLEEQGADTEAEIKEYRHVDIKITNGDFGDSKILTGSSRENSLLYTGGYDWIFGEQVYRYDTSIDGEGSSVEITGGKFPFDLSAYVDAEHKMSEQDGCYVVVELTAEDKQNAVVYLEQDGEPTKPIGWYDTFEKGWTAVSLHVQMGQNVTFKLLQDVTSGPIIYPGADTDISITFDLNGHELKVQQSDIGSMHFSKSTSEHTIGIKTLVVRDSSEPKKGRLNMVYLPNATEGGIYFYNTIRFVLESGTIIRTGGDIDNSSQNKRAIFRLPALGNSEGYFVTIKGGNVLSHLDGESQGYLIADSDARYDHPEDFYLDRYKDYISVNIPADGTIHSFSWDISPLIVDSGLDCKQEKGTNDFLVYTIGESQYSVGAETFTDFAKALAEAQSEGSSRRIDVLQDKLKVEGPVELDGITLNLNEYLNFTLSIPKGITLKNGASIQNGKSIGNVTVAGKGSAEASATLINFDMEGKLTVQEDAVLALTGGKFDGEVDVAQGVKLTISDGQFTKNVDVAQGVNLTISGGQFNGDVNFAKGAKLAISGGIFEGEVSVNGASTEDLTISGGSFKGKYAANFEQYFPNKYYGALKKAPESPETEEKFYDAETLYPVGIAPNISVQRWYSDTFLKNKENANTFVIKTIEDWNNFAIYVSGGANDFNGKLVKLDTDLDFSNATGVARLAATATEPNFLPAGSNANRFAGTFDGQNHTMSGIYAMEKNVGLFGATSYGAKVRIMNIKVEDSTFIVGSGVFDPVNEGATLVGGAIVGEGHLDKGGDGEQWSGNFTLSNVTVGHGEEAGEYFLGGVVGHSWAGVSIDGLRIQNKTTLGQAWKVGGVVGYLDGEFYLKNADIEQGTQPDGSDNGLILEGKSGYVGALVGHAHNGTNIVEDCTVLEHNDSLFGTVYDKRADITIKGSKTEMDIYKVVGDTLNPRHPASETNIELSGGVTEEDGVQVGSFQSQVKEDYLDFYEVSESGEKKDITEEVKQNSSEGGYTAKAELTTEVSIGGLVGEMTRGDALTMKVNSFTLYDIYGNPVDASLYGTITVTVTLKESDYNVGKQVALITSYTVSGEGEVNFSFRPIGNQAFIELDVQASTLTVKVNSDGSVSYDGFVGGENESVLGGQLQLDRVDNGDGTYTVTPSGLTSENYNIVYVSGIVPMTATQTQAPANNGNNVLWIVLGIMGGVAVLSAAAVIFTVRRKKN